MMKMDLARKQIVPGAGRFRRVCLPWLVLMALFGAGCAGKNASSESERYFWPIAVGEPKLEFLGLIQTDRDVRGSAVGFMEDVLLGQEPPRVLFAQPHDVAADGRGRVFVSDLSQRRVHVLDYPARKVRVLAPGPDDLHFFSDPLGLAVDGADRLYVSDPVQKKIYRFSADQKLELIFGSDDLVRPTALEADKDSGTVYVVDTGSHRIFVFDARGELVRAFGRRGEKPGEFNFPIDCALDSKGNLYVLDSFNARVQVFSPSGDFLRSFGERGTALGSFMIPKGIAVDSQDHVYVTDSLAHRFVVFDSEGRYLLTVGSRVSAAKGGFKPGGFDLPAGIAVDPRDGIWIADSLNTVLQRFQYLNAAYLAKNPILPGQRAMPRDLSGKP